MTLPGLFLFLHVFGVILWVGVGVALMFVTGRSRREENLRVTAFAYRVSDRLNRTLGLAGMILTMVGGIGLMIVRPGYQWFRPFPNHWLFQMQILGFLAFGVGAFYQVPLGGRLAREAEASAEQGRFTEAFQKYRKRNAVVGSINGLVLLVIVVLGTLRP